MVTTVYVCILDHLSYCVSWKLPSGSSSSRSPLRSAFGRDSASSVQVSAARTRPSPPEFLLGRRPSLREHQELGCRHLVWNGTRISSTHQSDISRTVSRASDELGPPHVDPLSACDTYSLPAYLILPIGIKDHMLRQ